MRLLSLTTIGLAALEMVAADLAFDCTSTLSSGKTAMNDTVIYTGCGADKCNCKAFDVLCLIVTGNSANRVISLESKSFDYAFNCTGCACNIQDDWADRSANVNDGVAMPPRLEAQVVSVTELEALAAKAGVEQGLWAEIQREKPRGETIVNHPFNQGKPNALSPKTINKNVPLVSDKCTGEVTCDSHFELDWSYRLRSVTPCAEVFAKDPCFGTNACVCDNGFYSIAENMPSKPSDYEALTNLDGLDEDKTWLYILIACSAIVFIIAVFVGVTYGVKACSKNRDRTVIQPFKEGDGVEFGDAAHSDEKGYGSVNLPKPDDKHTYPQQTNVGHTEDGISGMDMVEPTSMLGVSNSVMSLDQKGETRNVNGLSINQNAYISPNTATRKASYMNAIGEGRDDRLGSSRLGSSSLRNSGIGATGLPPVATISSGRFIKGDQSNSGSYNYGSRPNY